MGVAYVLDYKLQHWYAVLHNLDEDKRFCIDFGPQGIRIAELSTISSSYFVLRDPQPQDRVKNGWAIGRWLEGLNTDYFALTNNCQHFIKGLCGFM